MRDTRIGDALGEGIQEGRSAVKACLLVTAALLMSSLGSWGPLGTSLAAAASPVHPYLSALSHSGYGIACGTAVDADGNIYVADYEGGTAGISIYDPSGSLITTTTAAGEHVCDLAVDSSGDIYANFWQGEVVRLVPSTPTPQASTTYSLDTSLNGSGVLAAGANYGVAVDPSNDHVYVSQGDHISEYLPDGSVVDATIGTGLAGAQYYGIDVWGLNHDVYANNLSDSTTYIFSSADLAGAPKAAIDGREPPSETPDGGMSFGSYGAGLAVDQANGHVYVFDDTSGATALDEFEASGAFVSETTHSFEDGEPTAVAVSPPSAPNAGDVFVAGLHKLDAFGPGTYASHTLTVDKSGTGMGTVTGGGLDCGATCSNEYPEGAQVTLTASPGDTSEFTGWSGACTGIGACVITMSADMSVTADFVPRVPSVAASVTAVTETEATLAARINPQGSATSYHFEWGADEHYGQATPVPDGSVGSGTSPREVHQVITGLEQGKTYHFRLVAQSSAGTAVTPDREFATTGEQVPVEQNCPNEAIRAGLARLLPDCRAYELVTPPDTGSVAPYAAGFGSADGVDCFATDLATADGQRVAFSAKGGSLPGLISNGRFDLYESVRGSGGWQTESRSASGLQSPGLQGGQCLAPDHSYSTLLTGSGSADAGSLVVNGEPSSYIRGLDGNYLLVGKGALATDPEANVRWISPGGTHVVFTSQMQIERNAPEGIGPAPDLHLTRTGTIPVVAAVYDRRPDGSVDVLSLLPGDEAPDPATETTYYLGTSRDGSSVVFEVVQGLGGQATLYERRDGATVEIASAAHPNDFEYGGISNDGSRVLYLLSDSPAEPLTHEWGSIRVFDAATESTEVVTAGGAALVNVSADASHVYFASSNVLTGSEENGHGAMAIDGAVNLYGWSEPSNATRFIANLASADISRESVESISAEQSLIDWTTDVVAPDQDALTGPANDPSRTTPTGSVLVFESHAPITSYESGGRKEIYRYDIRSGDLDCVSCPSLGVAAAGGAALEPLRVAYSPLVALDQIENITDDGQKLFFQTPDALVPRDVNGTWDVYEWENGNTHLISPGTGSLPTFLWSTVPDGRDVFFLSMERLVAQDSSTVASIYDAREGGGFATPQPTSHCDLGANCQQSQGEPQLPSPASSALHGHGNAKPRHRSHRRRHRSHRRRHRRHHGHGRHKHERASQNRRTTR